MVSYKIEWKKSSVKELRKINKAVVPKIIETVESLAANLYPMGVKKLIGSENKYRVRVGDYRIVYAISEALLIIKIIRVGHRKDIHKK